MIKFINKVSTILFAFGVFHKFIFSQTNLSHNNTCTHQVGDCYLQNMDMYPNIDHTVIVFIKC